MVSPRAHPPLSERNPRAGRESYSKITLMVFLLYNKVLLRALVVLTGLGVAGAAWYYAGLSAQKLGAGGVRDALAIISFLVAGWLVMVIAEVIDNHYVRAFACLCVMLGGIVSYRWIFLVDGPELRELPAGPGGMLMTAVGYWLALLLALLLFVLLVIRLVLDKVYSGRRPAAAVGADVGIGPRPAGVGEPPKAEELPPIPLDTSPLAVSSAPAAARPAPAAPRAPASVSKLTGIGGMYLGTSFALSPGEHSIGRQEADFELSNDSQVSRRHASLTVGEQGIASLRDLGSTNGTFVNNQRVESIELAPGDVIRIGTSLFKAEA
jgi:hypothetical protein